ncbi:MAG: hypothetical protein AB7F25_02480 [Deferribacterales bacterium]
MRNNVNIRVHNSKSIEMKLEYVPAGAPDRSDYQIDLFLFFPNNMGVNESTYEKKHFYQDLSRNIRLKTPDFYLNNYYKRLKHFDDTSNVAMRSPSCEYMYKKFVCGYRAMLRNHTLNITDASTQDEVGLLLEHVEKNRNIFRKLRKKHDGIEMFTLGDEFTSVVTNIYLVRLYDRLSASHREMIADTIREELHYRQEHYPQSTAGDDEQNEKLINRYEWLKNYFYTILHLTAKRKKADTATTVFVYAAAAGLSMVFATVIAFWAQQRYGNFTMPFFAALVLGYMFKDRIKESSRAYLRKKFSAHIYDFETRIYESSKKHAMGKTYEKSAFITVKDLPAYAVNGYDPADNIIRFSKKVRINHRKIKEVIDGEIDGVTDIMRLNVRRFISGLEEPLTLVYSVSDTNLEKKYVEKTYDMNIILRVAGKDGEAVIRGVLTVSARGIKRFRMD